MLYLSAPSSKASGIPLKNPKRVKGEAGDIENIQKHGEVAMVQREEIRSRRKEGTRFEGEGEV